MAPWSPGRLFFWGVQLNIVYDDTGRAFRVGQPWAHGGEGAISCLEESDGLCLKTFHKPPDAIQEQRLRLLCAKAAGLADVAALPRSLAYTDARREAIVGIILPLVRGRSVFELYNTRTRLTSFPKANFRFFVETAGHLAGAFAKLHNNDIVIGDVNERNIEVLPDATVRLIDCDSFQIAEQGCVFTSNMGTPLWTPPELQGLDLTGRQRTPNHDLFGLAQLIFLLLFAGRHPFAGVPRGSLALSPEDAIRACAFAFAPQCLGLPLAPPPGCPPLTALPPEMQHNFLRAFLKGSELPGARPTAVEWQAQLARLCANLTVCTHQPNHLYWRGINPCPWCGIIRDTGVNVFPTPANQSPAVVALPVIDESLACLHKLAVYPFQVQRPPSFPVQPAALPTMPTGVWGFIQRCLRPARRRQRVLIRALHNEQRIHAEARAAVRRSLREQHAIIAAYHEEFHQARTGLEARIPPVHVLEQTDQASAAHKQFQQQVAQCVARLQTAQQHCAQRLQTAQAAAEVAAQQRDQARVNIVNLISHLRNGSRPVLAKLLPAWSATGGSDN